MIARHVQTIFCDDIRFETGNKHSFMGVYGGQLFIPDFPAILPKLCLSIQVVTPLEEPLSSLSLRVLQDDEVLREINVSEEDLASALENLTTSQEDETLYQAQIAKFLLIFSPINFSGPCTLRVRAQIDGDEHSGLGLRIERPPEQGGEP